MRSTFRRLRTFVTSSRALEPEVVTIPLPLVLLTLELLAGLSQDDKADEIVELFGNADEDVDDPPTAFEVDEL